MIYYPMSTLMLAGIRQVLLISTPHDLPLFKRLFGDGSGLGMEISYAEQARPEGLAQAFHIGASFVGSSPSCLILGDNLFYGSNLSAILRDAAGLTDGAVIFACEVNDPTRYGVVEIDDDGRAVSIVEKPAHPKSPFAVPGIYFYGPDVVELARDLKPSARGELEITDLNRIYMKQGRMRVKKLGRGVAWLDTGTMRSLSDATNFIQAVEERLGVKIGCLEEIAWRQGWIDDDRVRLTAESMGKSTYSQYLLRMLERGKAI